MTDADDNARVGQLLRLAASHLGGGADARVDADLLLAHVLQRDRGWLIAHGDDVLGQPARDAFRLLVDRRSGGEPIAYLTGRRGFHNLELAVTPDVLIPRPETELLVELALDRIPTDAAARIADLGTGSGAIALALGAERPLASILAVDASAGALRVADANARALGLRNVTFVLGSWLDAVGVQERFDLIASNPPYIAEDDVHLAHGDLRFEPRMALVSGADGLDAIRAIVRSAKANLRPSGHLLIEHGSTQAADVRALLEQAGFADVRSWRDLNAHERVSGGSSPG